MRQGSHTWGRCIAPFMHSMKGICLGSHYEVQYRNYVALLPDVAGFRSSERDGERLDLCYSTRQPPVTLKCSSSGQCFRRYCRFQGAGRKLLYHSSDA